VIAESIYSVALACLRAPGTASDGAPPLPRGSVLYCDICRRWGLAGTTHVCWRNWRVRLSDLLLDLTSDSRAR
jgi:hypothetical protein